MLVESIPVVFSTRRFREAAQQLWWVTFLKAARRGDEDALEQTREMILDGVVFHYSKRLSPYSLR